MTRRVARPGRARSRPGRQAKTSHRRSAAATQNEADHHPAAQATEEGMGLPLTLTRRPDHLYHSAPRVAAALQATGHVADLAVAQVLQGYHCERRWIRHIHSSAQWRAMFPYLPDQPGYHKRLKSAQPLLCKAILTPAACCPSWCDDLWMTDATAVPCGASRETVQRSDLAGRTTTSTRAAVADALAPRPGMAEPVEQHLQRHTRPAGHRLTCPTRPTAPPRPKKLGRPADQQCPQPGQLINSATVHSEDQH
jgi:hypothetical protein